MFYIPKPTWDISSIGTSIGSSMWVSLSFSISFLSWTLKLMLLRKILFNLKQVCP